MRAQVKHFSAKLLNELIADGDLVIGSSNVNTVDHYQIMLEMFVYGLAIPTITIIEHQHPDPGNLEIVENGNMLMYFLEKEKSLRAEFDAKDFEVHTPHEIRRTLIALHNIPIQIVHSNSYEYNKLYAVYHSILNKK